MKRELAIKIGIVALAIAVRLGLIYYFLVVHPTNIVSDGIEYLLIARGFELGEPYLLGYLIARPPLFPLVVFGVRSLFGDAPVYVAITNTLFSSLTCVVGYDLAKRFSGDIRVPLLTALILALDPTLAVVATFVQAEPLANLLLGLSLLSLARLVQERQPAEALWAGLWLALSALARPTSLYFAAAAVAIFILLLPRATWWRYFIIFAILPVAAGFGWTWRNYQTAGVFTYASVADFNMLYYRAVAVEHWATGEDPDAIRQRYAWEVEQRVESGVPREKIDSGYFWINFAPQDQRRLTAMRDIAIKVYLAYPFWYVATIPIGLYNMLATSMELPVWRPVEIGLNVVFYLFALRGLWLAWRAGRRDLAIISLTTILYFIAATLASQTTGMSTRMRSPFTILLAVLAAEGIVAPLALRSRRASQ
ncbi:MAG: glycosyltransferase family 39 protein [Chloroflexi bacterium]|nr:glycosyltransferase family 39 protein [Chloroflexota bacterium]